MPQLENIISLSPKEGIDVWNLQGGTHTRAIQLSIEAGSNGPVFIDDEHIVVPQYGRALLMVVNWKTGQVKIRSNIAENVKPMALSNDRQYLAAGSASGKVYIWNMVSGECVKILDAHYKGISSIAFTDEDAFLLTGGDDGILNVWVFGDLIEAEDIFANKLTDSASGSSFVNRLTPFIEFSNHSLPVTSIVCGVNSSGGGKIITTSLDRTVKIFSLVTRSMIASYSFPSGLTNVCLDPAETFLCVGSIDHKIYKVLLLAQQQRDDGSTANTNTLTSLFANMQAKSNKMTQASAISATTNSVDRDMLIFDGHSGDVTALSLSLNGTIMVSSGSDGTVRLWDVPTRTLMKTLTGNRASVAAVRVIPDVIGAINMRNECMNKKTFPHFSKHCHPALPLYTPIDTLRPNICRNTVAFVHLPQVLPDPYPSSLHFDPLLHAPCMGDVLVTGPRDSVYAQHAYTNDELDRLCDADDLDMDINVNVIVPTSTTTETKQDTTQKGKKRKIDADSETTDSANTSSSGKTIEELEAEVKKWKKTASELYKKVQAKK